MHMFEWAYLYMNVCAHRGQKKASELPGARVTGIYEPPEVGVEGQTWVLWETSAWSYLLRHLSKPHLLVSTSMTLSGLFSQRSPLLNTLVIFPLLLAATVWMKMNKKGISKGSQSQYLPEFLWVSFWLHLFYCMSVCTSCRAYVRTEGNYGSPHSPPTVWVSGINLRLSRWWQVSTAPPPQSLSQCLKNHSNKQGWSTSSHDPVWMSSKGHGALFGWPQRSEKKPL